MSATLDGARFSGADGRRAGDRKRGAQPSARRCAISAARPRRGSRIGRRARSAPRCARQTGGVLAFLPGVAEIERTAERLDGLGDDIVLHRLHGSLDPAAQRAAIAPDPHGRRKIVLATSIAETSLTLDGIRVVVDSGLARRPRYDRAAGMTRLVTERASQAAVTQRAGRAARQGPGIAYRLWEEAATAGPAALRSARNPRGRSVGADARLRALGRRRSARARLARSAARSRDRRGARAAGDARRDRRRRPADRAWPRDRPAAAAAAARRICWCARARSGWRAIAAEVAVLLGERGLGGTDPDLETRLRRWRGERGRAPKAGGSWRSAGRSLPLPRGRGWGGASERAPRRRRPRPLPQRERESRHRHRARLSRSHRRGAAMPRARPGRRSAGAASGSIPTSSLARAEWLAVAETQGMAAGRAHPVRRADRRRHRRGAVRRPHRDPPHRRVRSRDRRGRRRCANDGSARSACRAGPIGDADPATIAAALLDGVRAARPRAAAVERGGARAARARRLCRRRARSTRSTMPRCSPRRRMARRRCSPASAGSTRSTPARSPTRCATLIGWDALQAIDRLAPTAFRPPAGQQPRDRLCRRRRARRVELRPQALFGLADASDGRRRARAAGAQPDLARRPADPDDARSARFLGGELGRGREGNARPLSAPSLARRSRRAPRRRAHEKCGCARARETAIREAAMTDRPHLSSAPRTPCSRAAPAPIAGCSNSSPPRRSAPIR